ARAGSSTIADVSKTCAFTAWLEEPPRSEQAAAAVRRNTEAIGAGAKAWGIGEAPSFGPDIARNRTRYNNPTSMAGVRGGGNGNPSGPRGARRQPTAIPTTGDAA